MSDSSRRQAVSVERIPRVAAVFACVVATVTLAGWSLGLPVLTNLVPGYPAMNPLTALCVLQCGIAVWLIARPSATHVASRRVGKGLGALVLGIAVARCATLALAGDGAPDLMLFADRLRDWPVPSRMGVHTALALGALGGAILLLDAPERRRWHGSDVLLLVAIAIPLTATIGYLYLASPMHGFMAPNTAPALLALAIGVVASKPDRGLAGLVRSETAGAVMARRVLPAAMIVPFVLGWLRLAGQKAGLFGLEMGTAVLMLSIVAVMVTLVWWAAQRVNRLERERQSVEHELVKSLERQARLLEANLMGVLTAKTDGWIVEANAAFLEMIGYRRDELPLRSADITPPEWKSQTDEAVASIRSRGVATPFEKEYLHKDGHRVPVLVGAASTSDATGEVMAFVVDLSGKKHVELELARTRLFLDSIIENLPNMVFVKDADDLRFVRFNRAGEALLGFPREDLLGKNDYDFFPREEADFFTAKDRRVLDSGEQLDMPAEPLRTRSGEQRVLHTKKVPILDQDGRPRYLLGISEDITDRIAAERELATLHEGLKRRTRDLEVANRELESFSYSVSHDLRAPLRHIDGFTDLLTRHAGQTMDEKGRRYLETISSSARSMGRLIDDLLAFSRMGRAEMQNADVDLTRLVGAVQAELVADQNGRSIDWRIAPLPIVRGDESMLRLVLMNLLGNAVKYTRGRERATIEVGCRANPEQHVIYVKDDGAGFDMKYAGKLFGVFQRLHRDDEFEGTGIGLANVRRIVHRHGGQTWAEGALDQGATFYVALPRTAEQENREAA